MKRVQELPKSSSHLLTSSQVITSVFCVVKELVENALDSSCTNIEVKLDNCGLDKIEVRDNGSGIDACDVVLVTKPHYTSKITSHLDLETVQTYGFRGEALSALCAISNLSIVTKTAKEDIGTISHVNHNGEIISSKPYSCNQGTVVSASNLFCNMPVRKQYYKSEKHRREELKKVEDLLIALACAQPSVRFALYHNKNLIWQKSSVNNVRGVLFQVFGDATLRCMDYVELFNEEFQIKIESHLPKQGPKLPSTSHTAVDRCIVLVNKRPVRMKVIDKLLHDIYNKTCEGDSKSRYPICYLSITVPPNMVDVNFEPNKTEVLFHCLDTVTNMLASMLNEFYKLDTPLLCVKNTEISSAQVPSTIVQSNKKEEIIANKHLSNQQLNDNNNVENQSIEGKSSALVFCKDKENNSPCIITSMTIEPISQKQRKSTNRTDNCNLATNKVLNHIRTIKSFYGTSNDAKESESGQRKNPLIDVSTQSSDISSISDNESSVNKTIHQRKRRFSDSSLLASQNSEIQSIKKRPDPSSTEHNVDSWSRGVGLAGKAVQPVDVLIPVSKASCVDSEKGDKNLIEINGTIPLKTKEASFVRNNEQNQSIFGRQMTGFDYFCRRNRLEVSALNPEFNNHQIAQVLSKMWNDLTEEEKGKYKSLNLNTSSNNTKNKDQLKKSICKSPASVVTVKKEKPKKPSFRKKAESKVFFSFKSVKTGLTSKSRCRDLQKQSMNIINSLAPGIWIYSKNHKLNILNSFRLQETNIYHRLLETYELKPDLLVKPIELKMSSLDGSDVLLSLNDATNGVNGSNISDKRITANGFVISLTKLDADETIVKISAMTSKISFYGSADLSEILNTLKTKGVEATLPECRPAKVLYYLQGEAVRIARQCCTPSKKDVEDIITQRKCLPANCETCIHDKPFSYELCKIDK